MQTNTKQQIANAIYHIIALFALVAVAVIISDSISSRHGREFVNEFNAAVSPALRQDNADAIKAIAPGYDISGKYYAKLWTFADKYNITEFPKLNGDYKTNRRTAIELVKQLEAVDEYIEQNHIDSATASKLLNQAFAISNNNLVSILQTENN